MVEQGTEPTQPSLRLCDFIQQWEGPLLLEWERRVRTLPVAAPLGSRALRNHVPQLLERMATFLRGDAPDPSLLLGELPDKHALERLDEGYDLRTVTRELALLRDLILEWWEREAGPSVTTREARRLNLAIDTIIADSADRFVRARERTLRALDAVYAASLESGDVDALLQRLMRVLLETVAAVDTVAVLLRNGGDVLHLRAAVGLAEDLSRGFSVRVGEGFAGTVAQRREPVLLRDASSDPLILSPQVRAQRIHAVYGVPLLHEGHVIGVAQMGSRTAYDFSEDDRQLFRAMAQRATAFIVQAQLAEEVRRGEAQLHAIVDHAPAAIYIKDMEGRFLLANRHMEELFHRPRAELLGKTDYDLWPEPAADALHANDLQVYFGGRPMTAEEVVPREDGAHTYLSVKFPLPDARGHPYGLCGISTDITERKHVEAALRESEERFRLLVERVEDYAIFMLDPKGRVVSWNPGAERIKGYRAEEILGQSFTRFYPPEQVEAGEPWRGLERAAAAGRYELEGPRVRKDGSRIWAHVVFTALRDEAGRLRGFAEVTRDITARKRTEQALRETGERLEAILDTAVDGILTTDAHGLIQTVNPATTRIFGYAPEALVGQPVSRLLAEPDRSLHAQGLEDFLRTGGHEGGARETRGQRKDGSTFPMELSVSEMRLPEGRLFTGLVRDISQRRAAQEAQALLIEVGTLLAQSLDVPGTLRSLASHTVAHLADYCVVDLLGEDGQLHRLEALARDGSKQELMRRLMEYPPRLGSGSPVARALEKSQPTVVDVTPAVLDTMAYTPEHRAILEQLAPRSGAFVPLVARGRRLGLILLVSTEPGAMTRPSTLEVVQAVADRAAIAIDNARLYQEAQDAVRVREDVVAIVSHDLRNPLNAISMSASTLIKREDLDARTAKAATRIYAAADRAHRLIHDLLDFTQARVSGIPIHPRPAELHTMARQVVEEVRSAYPERHIDFHASGDGHGEWDPDRLAQVLANLIGNAVQHSPPDTPVQVTASAEGDSLFLEVRNQGIPIAPEVLPTLFEPFQRGQDAGTGVGGSLGLGLFITRQIVEAHGGDIAVRSSAEEGTVFTVRLPRWSVPHRRGQV